MIGKFIGKYLLRFFIVTLILVYGLSVVTEYNILRPIVSDFSTKLVNGNLTISNQNVGEQITANINEYCKTHNEVIIPGYESTPIDCREVQSNNMSSLSEFVTNTLMKDYYKEYDCSAVGCLVNIFYNRNPENMKFIFSEKMNLFLKSLIPFLFLGILLSIVIMIYAIKEKFEIFREIGVTLLGAAGIPFIILLIIMYKDTIFVSTGILSGKEDFMRATTDFFSGAIYKVAEFYLYLYGIVVIIGGILFIIGYVGNKRKSVSKTEV